MMKNIVLKVEGMSCGHCVSAIEKALKDIGADGTVDLEASRVEVRYDEAILDLNAIKEAIENQGYDVISSLA